MKRLPLGVLLLFSLFLASGSTAFLGNVVSILDGDTIEVLHHQHTERIRLSGIDCPEKGQAFGKKAKYAASALAFGKEVTIQAHGHDKYERILGNVILPDGRSLNQELVKQGWCWWYRKYTSDDTVLEGLEKATREARKGLWDDLRRCRRGNGDREDSVTRVSAIILLFQSDQPSTSSFTISIHLGATSGT